MSKQLLADLTTRQLAINPTHSFIVQAPAGSGKTSLLVERYLTLLAHVANPEEILALTFTRKAAYEMQTRILHILKTSNTLQQAQTPHSKSLHKLALAVLKQDQQKKWHLLQNPQRLRIQTIDAFCYNLTTQSPLASGINSYSTIIQNQEVEFYYHQAAQTVLTNIAEPKYKHPLTCLLLHLDNNWERAEKLLVMMLKSREQWLPHIVGLKNIDSRRHFMEKALTRIGLECVENCSKLFPQYIFQELRISLKSIIENFSTKSELFTTIASCKNPADIDLITWQNLARLFLTKEFSWRKTITKEDGFPIPPTKNPQKKLYKILKSNFQELLENLSQYPNLRQNLENLLLAPPPRYNDDTWELIESLLELLPLLVAHLKIIFTEKSLVDHSEISQTAERLLGDAEDPSILALNLDYRIQHLLIDEFQDTSLAQFRLLEKLITTWQTGDGRTFFAVGDPMQSIYRFREAEVGLFLRVIQDGIGNLRPQTLTLTTNFRTSRQLVTWINDNFTKILPPVADISFGAVPFVKASGTFDYQGSPVKITLNTNTDDNCEAQEVITLIQKIVATNPEDTLAILVRSRKHLQKILPVLRAADLTYQANETETLAENMVIRDLYSLTCALFDLSNRTAWLAVLRAPWCGLSLADLHMIANTQDCPLIWDTLCKWKQLELSIDGKQRLHKFQKAILPMIECCRRITWRELISKTWLAIGGPATINEPIELDFAEAYFTLLVEPLDINLLQQKLYALYTPITSSKTSTTNRCNIHVMTIHKAKGLEFEHVIIPGINRATRGDAKKLLLWFERPRIHSGSDLLIAPIALGGEKHNQIYHYLRQVERKKSFYETGRLLYVAMTRTKKTVHLYGTIANNEKIDFTKSLIHNSLLEQLKSCYDGSWLNKTTLKNPTLDSSTTQPSSLTRLTSTWHLPITVKNEPQQHLPTFTPITKQAEIIGSIIHFCLRMLTTTTLPIWDKTYIKQQLPFWRKLLIQYGYIDIEHGLTLIKQAIKNTLNDQRGRWILEKHKDAASELALTTKISDKFRHYIIDRTFIDKDGTRWIIDYKTSAPNAENKNAAIAQLNQYASLFATLTPQHPIKLGVYFPLCSKWYETTPNI